MSWKAKAEFVIKDVDLDGPIINVLPYFARKLLMERKETPLSELDKKVNVRVKHADLQPFYKQFEGKHKKKRR